MRRSFPILALCLSLVFTAAPCFAADVAHGSKIFSNSCAACHMGGGNIVNAQRTLKRKALDAYLDNYTNGHQEAIIYQVVNGKNAMPAFSDKLSADDITDVAAYIEDMASKGWT